MITLTHPTANAGNPQALVLPPDLQWSNEFAWQRVQQSVTYTTTGAALVEAAVKQTGRPITLEGDQDYAWCLRGALSTINDWAALPGQAFTLQLHLTTFNVVFDHEQGAVGATPVVPFADPQPEDLYQVTLKFLEL